MTGASGYIGSMITEFAIEEGYDSDAKLTSLGPVPVRGELSSLDAQIVLHLADAWGFTLRIDAAAVDAMGESLHGTGKPLVVTSGAETTESTPPWQTPLNDRIRAEQNALQMCEKGVQLCAIRRGESVNNGEVIYVNDGGTRTSTVHSDDAARLFLAKAGDDFNGTSSTDVTARQMAEAMGSALNLSVRSLTFEETASKIGELLATFLSAENRASNAKAIRELGWQPREPGIPEVIRTGQAANY
ncbi:hypothetical protein V1519DRAFT_469620 [Lipomyces tetrasporus]